MTEFGDQLFHMGGVPVGAPVDQGKAIWLVASATDGQKAELQTRGVANGDIFTDAATAIAQLRSGYNDTLYVMPGDHAVTAEINITQHQVRIIGMSGPNMGYTASTSTTANNGVTRFKCVTANVARIFDVTGSYVQFINIATFNSYDDADNVCDVYVGGRNFYANRCEFRGGNGGTTQMGGNYGIPLVLGACYGSRFDDCKIGSPGNYTRTSGPGFVMFETAGGSGMIQFNSCIFAMRSETTGANCSGFLIQETSIDRALLFNNCLFYNFSVNWGAIPDFLINDDQTTTHTVLFYGGCCMSGFDTMGDSTTKILTSDPLPHTEACEALGVKVT